MQMIVWTQVAIILATFVYYTRLWEPGVPATPLRASHHEPQQLVLGGGGGGGGELPPAVDKEAGDDGGKGARPRPAGWRIGVGELLVAGTREPLLRALLRGSYGLRGEQQPLPWLGGGTFHSPS